MELRFSKPPEGSPVFKYVDVDDDLSLGSPRLVDPLDRRNVYVSNTTLNHPGAGEGLFAKRDIPADSLISHCCRMREYGHSFSNQTSKGHGDLYKNLLLCRDEEEIFINVPPPYDDLVLYRATLGHKV